MAEFVPTHGPTGDKVGTREAPVYAVSPLSPLSPLKKASAETQAVKMKKTIPLKVNHLGAAAAGAATMPAVPPCPYCLATGAACCPVW